MQDTRTRTSTKASASSARGRARFEVLLLGANVAWIGVFWPWLLRGSTATWDVVVAVLGPGALWLGTLPETGTQAEQADEKSLIQRYGRGVCLLVAFPTWLAVAVAGRPEARNLLILGPPALALLGLSLCAYGAVAARACAPRAEQMAAQHLPLSDGPWDAPSKSRGWLQGMFIGACCAGAVTLVFVAPTWGGAQELASAWGDAAMAGGVLVAVVGTALGVATLTVFLGDGLRTAHAVTSNSGAALRTSWFVFLALLGAVTYVVVAM